MNNIQIRLFAISMVMLLLNGCIAHSGGYGRPGMTMGNQYGGQYPGSMPYGGYGYGNNMGYQPYHEQGYGWGGGGDRHYGDYRQHRD